MRKYQIILLLLMISGCSPLTFVKNGINESEYKKDIYQCKLDAMRSGSYGNSIMGSRSIITECMEARGYTTK